MGAGQRRARARQAARRARSHDHLWHVRDPGEARWQAATTRSLTVTDLAAEIGFDAIDAGPRRLARFRSHGPNIVFRLLRRCSTGLTE